MFSTYKHQKTTIKLPWGINPPKNRDDSNKNDNCLYMMYICKFIVNIYKLRLNNKQHLSIIIVNEYNAICMTLFVINVNLLYNCKRNI